MPRGNRSSRSVGLVTDGHEGLGRDPGFEDGAPAVEDACSRGARPAGRRVAHAGDEVIDGVGVALRLDLCMMEALPGSTFGKKTQVRESLSRKDQENMIARSNRAFQTGTGPDPYPSPAPPRAAEGVSGWRS